MHILIDNQGYVDTFNPIAYKYISRWKAHRCKMLLIERENKYLYSRLVGTVSINPVVLLFRNDIFSNLQKPVYSSLRFEKEWQKNVMKMAHMAKFTLQMFLEKTVDRMVQEMPSISGDLPKLKPRPLCYMDFRIKDGVFLGRIIVELYTDYVPMTAENFVALCKGTRGFGYKCCRIYNIVKGQYLEMGDITMNNGKGGMSIFGEFFHEENFSLKHTKPGKAKNYSFKLKKKPCRQ